MAKPPIKRPRDPIQLAKMIGDIATGQVTDQAELNSAAVLRGRKGGLKGGQARAGKLSPEERAAIAKSAALARWAKKPNET